MPKNILVFSDGTGQQGGVRPDQVLSNVYKLYRASRVSGDNAIDPRGQIAFYDPGLGTINDTGIIRLSAVDKLRSIFGLAFGIGITGNIIDCYEFILANYQPGDRIFLFGFSRGAYTVRSVAGVLRMCGVPTHDANKTKLPTSGPKLRSIAKEAVKDVYEFRIGKDGWRYTNERLDRGLKFRQKYGSAAEQVDESRHVYSNVSPYLIGVFDTVAALVVSGWRRVALFGLICGAAMVLGAVASGLVVATTRLSFLPLWAIISGAAAISTLLPLYVQRWRSASYDESLDFRVKYARHAMAIDEWRADFHRVGWGRSTDVAAHKKEEAPGDAEWLKQIWFAGDHSDIGGGYLENESRLSDVALHWMVEEINSTEHPLHLSQNWLNVFPDPAGMQHDEIAATRENWLHIPWKRKVRTIVDGSVLHASVLERFRCGSVKNFRTWGAYRPENLRGHSAVARYYKSDAPAPAHEVIAAQKGDGGN
jgi:hypothetical protein